MQLVLNDPTGLSVNNKRSHPSQIHCNVNTYGRRIYTDFTRNPLVKSDATPQDQKSAESPIARVNTNSTSNGGCKFVLKININQNRKYNAEIFKRSF